MLIGKRLNYIHAQNEIDNAQAIFQKRFRSDAKIGTVRVGYQGGHRDLEVAWLPSIGIWAGWDKLDNRYWNAFGVGRPKERPASNSIIVEINFPLQGIDRGISGVLAKDEDGLIWVCHRGIINRVSRAVFWSAYKGTKAWVWEKDEVAVIGSISNSDSNTDFLAQVSTFVKFVRRLRARQHS